MKLFVYFKANSVGFILKEGKVHYNGDVIELPKVAGACDHKDFKLKNQTDC